MAKNLFLILSLLSFLFTAIDTKAQTRSIPHNSDGFYVGVQVNSPLFWGDMFSLGKETRLSYGSGVFAGYTLGGWFSPEFSLDYGIGRLGAKEHQLTDYITKAGIIKYIQSDVSDVKMGDIYSRTTYIQAGLRFQTSLLNMFTPNRYRMFDVEIAPVMYAQKFSPALYTVNDNRKLDGYGITGNDWSYAAGGDLGVRLRFSPKLSAHLRGGLLWMSNEAFEGVNNDPVWRVNLMTNASLGITFHLGSSKQEIPKSPNIITSSTSDHVERSTKEQHQVEQRQSEEQRLTEQRATEAEEKRWAEQRAEVEAERRITYEREVVELQIPFLFFRRGYADIDLERYQSNLDEIVRLLRTYAETHIDVEGWCDVTGSKAVNALLSQQRADALKNYLVKKGIDAVRFKSVQGMGVDYEGGYGQEARRAQVKLSVPNDSETERK